MGVSLRTVDIIARLEPTFVECFGGNPELSMSMVDWFAQEHGHSHRDGLSDTEIGDFEQLAQGIRFPIHPDQMQQAGKFGCDACMAVYGEWWSARTEDLVERLESGVKEEVPSDEVMRAAAQSLTESEAFLRGQGS